MPIKNEVAPVITIMVGSSERTLRLHGSNRKYLEFPGDVREAIKEHCVERARRCVDKGLLFPFDQTFRELVEEALAAEKRGESILDAVKFSLDDPGKVDEHAFQAYDVYVTPLREYQT